MTPALGDGLPGSLERYRSSLQPVLRRFFSLRLTPGWLPSAWTPTGVRFGAGLHRHSVRVAELGAELVERLGPGAAAPAPLEAGPRVRIRHFAAFLVAAHALYERAVGEAELEPEPRTVAVSPLEPSDYRGDPGYWRHVLEAHQEAGRRLESHQIEALVFGSVADRKVAPGFSDMDLLLRVGRAAFRSPASLVEARVRVLPILRRPYLFNPLHHHAPFPVLEADGGFLPDHLVPPALFEHARILGADRARSYTVRWVPAPEGRRRRFLERVETVVGLEARAGPGHVWELLRELSSFFLLAPLHAQLQGVPSYKPHAWSGLRHAHPDLDWELYDELSEIRAEVFPEARSGVAWLRWVARWNPLLVPGTSRRLGLLPGPLRHAFDPALYRRMAAFARALRRTAAAEGLVEAEASEGGTA